MSQITKSRFQWHSLQHRRLQCSSHNVIKFQCSGYNISLHSHSLQSPGCTNYKKWTVGVGSIHYLQDNNFLITYLKIPLKNINFEPDSPKNTDIYYSFRVQQILFNGNTVFQLTTFNIALTVCFVLIFIC